MIAKGTYSPQFKAEAALNLVKKKSVGKLAAQYEVHYTLLHKWRRKFPPGIPGSLGIPGRRGGMTRMPS